VHQKKRVIIYSDFGVCMKINETSIDSVIRIFASVLLFYLGFGGELAGALALAADILGVILLLTGVIGFCPLYALFRIRGKERTLERTENSPRK
jgi:hypothetical protein